MTPSAHASCIRAAGDTLAAVVFEPVVLGPPDARVARGAPGGDRRGSGALLIVDEIKTVGRLALGGGCERYGIRPDWW